jgi:hypothetical protein
MILLARRLARMPGEPGVASAQGFRGRPAPPTLRQTASLLVLLIAALNGLVAQSAPTPHRAILISFDGFSESRVRQFSNVVTAPTLWDMFRTGACAEAARPAFPSVTPTGHAALWTGAYGNVNGITARANGKLPLSQTSILDWIDGYRAPSLRAEPIWITAARQGKHVFSHMATQAPGPPGYPDVAEPLPEVAQARARAAATVQSLDLAAVNSTRADLRSARLPRRTVSRTRRAIGAGSTTPAFAGKHTAGIRVGVRQRGDSLHASHATPSGGAAVVSASRDASRGVVARVAPRIDRAARRALGRYSEPLR